MDVVTHVVRGFRVNLDQLHNDSTTITFTGQYAAYGREQHVDGQTIPAITWGHNKDHRPDLKQLLYILTVSEDGGVPIYFQTASGNVVDDQTHQATWKLLATLVKRPDFVYVADCKLATTDNMNEIARQGGRFITVLPASRKEDTLFRDRLRQTPRTVTWREVDRRTDEQGTVTRIVGLLTVYFFAMMLQALLERELRQAMKRDGLVSLPLYPEGRPCHRPTSRHVIDVFEPIARHALEVPGQEDPILFATELAPIHEQILTLLGVPRAHYRV